VEISEGLPLSSPFGAGVEQQINPSFGCLFDPGDPFCSLPTVVCCARCRTIAGGIRACIGAFDNSLCDWISCY